MTTNPTPQSRSTAWVGALLAALIAGSIAALSNVVNFVAARPTYFAAWAVAHLLAFGFGWWAARAAAGRRHPAAYVALGVLAGAVEAVIVFGALDGLIVVDELGYGWQLVAGAEDYVAAAATVVLFVAGAMRGLRARAVGPEGRPVGGSGRPAMVPDKPVTDFLSAAGPALTLASGLLKLLG
jgi:hypothetical protein